MVTQTDDILLVQMHLNQTSENAKSLWLSTFFKRGLIIQYRPWTKISFGEQNSVLAWLRLEIE